MTAESYFSQYRCLQSWLESDRQTLKALRASIGDVHAPEIHTDRVQVSPCGSAPYIRTLEILEHLRRRIGRIHPGREGVHISTGSGQGEMRVADLPFVIGIVEAIIECIDFIRLDVRLSRNIGEGQRSFVPIPLHNAVDAIDIRKELSQPDALDCA